MHLACVDINLPTRYLQFPHHLQEGHRQELQESEAQGQTGCQGHSGVMILGCAQPIPTPQVQSTAAPPPLPTWEFVKLCSGNPASFNFRQTSRNMGRPEPSCDSLPRTRPSHFMHAHMCYHF